MHVWMSPQLKLQIGLLWVQPRPHKDNGNLALHPTFPILLIPGCLPLRASTTTSKATQLHPIPRLRLLLHLHGHGHQPHLQHQPHHEGPARQVSVQDQFQVEQWVRRVSGWFLIRCINYPPPQVFQRCGLFWHHLWHPNRPHITGGGGKGQAEDECYRRWSDALWPEISKLSYMKMIWLSDSDMIWPKILRKLSRSIGFSRCYMFCSLSQAQVPLWGCNNLFERGTGVKAFKLSESALSKIQWQFI